MVSRVNLVVLLWSFAALCGMSTYVCFTHPNDVEALLAVKRGFIDNSNNLLNWHGDDPCGGWNGVLCSMAPCNVSTDYMAYYVSELRLAQFNLSGRLAPEIGDLGQVQTLNLMWNQLSGTIPASIAKNTYLQVLLLSGNQFEGVIPQELGMIPNLTRLQLDENHLSGPIPSTFVQRNLPNVQHIWLNNNSLSGQIPGALSTLGALENLMLDNNLFNGSLPVGVSRIRGLRILQLDNNKFDDGTTIPAEYGSMANLVKLSLKNCNLGGQIPNIAASRRLMFLDLSQNLLTGSFPNSSLPPALMTVDLSYNQLSGTLPTSLGVMGSLLSLELKHNNISGDIPSNVGTGPQSSTVFDFQENSLTGFENASAAHLQTLSNSSLWLSGNPLCASPLMLKNQSMCAPQMFNLVASVGGPVIVPFVLDTCCKGCPSPYSLAPNKSVDVCECKVPISVKLRLSSPSFRVFEPFLQVYVGYLASGLRLTFYQIRITDYTYQPGSRILSSLLLFPSGSRFDDEEVRRIHDTLAGWMVPNNDTFGPQEMIYFQPPTTKAKARHHGLQSGAILGIVLAVLTFVVLKTLCMYYFLTSWIRRRLQSDPACKSKRVSQPMSSTTSLKVSGVKSFTFEEMERATERFGLSRLVGQGGYGKVYSGDLDNGQRVAIKRAEVASHQGSREFETEILLLSRVHHRNLVSLIGYCVEDGEQMLVYEFIAYGSLYYHLTSPSAFPLSFMTRLQIAVGSARGIHYLHTEADPPIYHRDVKASNILLDETFQAKVSDFGLSKLASQGDMEGMRGHISTVVKGTPGYLDPEYFKTHHLTDKSDVYSFGVLLLVLFTGRQPIYERRNLVREVAYVVDHEDGKLASIVDSRIAGDYPMKIMEDLVSMALCCCRDAPAQRPTIAEVVAHLEYVWRNCCYDYAKVSNAKGHSARPSTGSEMEHAFGGGETEKDYISFSAEMLGNESDDFFIEIKPSGSSSATSTNTWTDSFPESSTDDIRRVNAGIDPR